MLTDSPLSVVVESTPLLNSIGELSWKNVLINTLKVTTPLVIANASAAMLDFLSNHLLSKQCTNCLAASVIISSSQVTIIVIASGLLLTVGNLSSEAASVKRDQEVGMIYRQSQLIAGITGTLLVPVFYQIKPILEFFGQNTNFTSISQDYFQAYAGGIPANLMVIASTQFASGLRKQLFILGVGVFNLPIFYFTANALAHHLEGNGVRGIGYAYAGINWLDWIIYQLYFYFNPSLKNFCLRSFSSLAEEWHCCKSLLKTSYPIALMLASEFGAFFAFNVFVGHLNKNDIETHNIVLQYVILSVVPLVALSESASILVGGAFGQDQFQTIRRYENAHLVMGLALSIISLLMFTIFPENLASLFIDTSDNINAPILEAAKWAFFIYAINQFFEAIRHTSLGTLRGIHDTFIPMLINSLCLWGIAVPAAYGLTKYTNLRVPGIALADSFGSFVSLFLLGRCLKKTTDIALHTLKTEQEQETSCLSPLKYFSLFSAKQDEKRNSSINRPDSALKKINVNRCGII